MANDEERKFRLRPRKPAVRRERRPLATAYKIIMHYARMSGVRKRRSPFATRPIWWALQDLNLRPTDYESCQALSMECDVAIFQPHV